MSLGKGRYATLICSADYFVVIKILSLIVADAHSGAQSGGCTMHIDIDFHLVSQWSLSKIFNEVKTPLAINEIFHSKKIYFLYFQYFKRMFVFGV